MECLGFKWEIPKVRIKMCYKICYGIKNRELPNNNFFNSQFGGWTTYRLCHQIVLSDIGETIYQQG